MPTKRDADTRGVLRGQLGADLALATSGKRTFYFDAPSEHFSFLSANFVTMLDLLKRSLEILG